MAVELKQHINLISENPLDARLTEKPFKAYLVANLAFIDGAEASAEHYEISIASVYAAMSFYEDNRDTIEQALKEDHEGLIKLGMVDGKKAIAEIKKRMQSKGNT